MPVLVRNTSTGPTVFSNGEKIHIEWKGAGDPGGEDVQYVDDDIATGPQFQRMIHKGIFTVVSEGDVADALARQYGSYEERTRLETEAARATIDAAPAQDYVYGVDQAGNTTTVSTPDR